VFEVFFLSFRDLRLPKLTLSTKPLEKILNYVKTNALLKPR
jgi:hypothetical protein